MAMEDRKPAQGAQGAQGAIRSPPWALEPPPHWLGLPSPSYPLFSSLSLVMSSLLPSPRLLVCQGHVPRCMASCTASVADRQAWPFAAALSAAWCTSTRQNGEPKTENRGGGGGQNHFLSSYVVGTVTRPETTESEKVEPFPES